RRGAADRQHEARSLASGPWPAPLTPPARLSTAGLPWGLFLLRTFVRRLLMTDRAPSPPDALSRAAPGRGRDITFMVVAMGVSLPWLALRLTGFHGDPATTAALAGLAIVGAAFVLSWAAEAFEKDVSQALALALLALIAVLPEYAVGMVFAWNAASDPAQASYA